MNALLPVAQSLDQLILGHVGPAFYPDFLGALVQFILGPLLIWFVRTAFCRGVSFIGRLGIGDTGGLGFGGGGGRL